MPRILDNVGSVAPDVFKLAVANGDVPNWETYRKFGMNDAIVAGTHDMWPKASVRTLPSAAAVVSVSSDNVADDGDPGGTGAWTLTIEGLDADYLEISETITLNGTTAVTTSASFLRVNRAYVVTAGSNESNVGEITGTIGGDPQFYVEPNEGQTHQVLYTVPANKKLILDTYIIGVGRMSGSTDLDVLGQIKLFGSDTSWRSISDIYLWNGGNHRNVGVATVIPPKTEIRMQVKSTTTTQAYGIAGGYLVKVS